MHADVSQVTYTDFGQNKGRYVVANRNALLEHLLAGGVSISYTGGQPAYTLPHGMIDFAGIAENGASAAVGFNFLATVRHNGVQNPSFAANDLGADACIRYTGIEYRSADEFLHTPSNDYKITRLSKLVTDVTGSPIYGSATGDYSGITGRGLEGQLIYRAGAGTMYRSDADGRSHSLCGAYAYITGGIDRIDSVGSLAADGAFSTFTYYNAAPAGISDSEPLPFCIQSGDSGSPAWVWNGATGRYEYLDAGQSGGGTMSQNRGNCPWSVETMARYDKGVTLGSGATAHLGAITLAGETLTDAAAHVASTLYSGVATDEAGNELARYNGVQAGINTWNDLSPVKDRQNWYNYGSEYLNASANGSGKSLTYADLFHNDNLVFTAEGEGERTVQLDATVDLGVGYVRFTGAEGSVFTVQSGGEGQYQLNSAGYVVDEGVTLRLKLTNPADTLREWRKTGAGTLSLSGSGNNEVLLNLGEAGTTSLNREGGYAAYNVLANNGARVVIRNIGQIARDFTFGYRGGVLDMNGQSMEWNNDHAASAEGFTIHALDEGALITNSAVEKVVLRWTQGGAQGWLGSFADTAAGALEFRYAGGGHLTLHSTHTELAREGSGMVVENGIVTLVGTNTVHGLGSQSGTNTNRYHSDDDWHCADARMDVAVASGATFELGSHARLTGDVSVAGGGRYVMREGVQHRMEFIEGGEQREDTDAIRDYVGHKGDIVLEAGGRLEVAFSAGTDSTLVYAGHITGAGDVSVDLGAGTLVLGGQSSFYGAKTLVSGGLHAASNAALGDVSATPWLVGAEGWLACDGFATAADILAAVDGRSTGVLALTQDIAEEISLADHPGLIIGAARGTEVHYGSAGQELSAVDGSWTLGGGGGKLIVDFRLTGQNDLVLGNASARGKVHLANAANDFTGSVRLAGGVTLTYEAGALGQSTVDLAYGASLELADAGLRNVAVGSQGAVLVDALGGNGLDLSAHPELALGSQGDARYAGTLTLAEGAPYRFGGGTGQLAVAAPLDSAHDLLIDAQGSLGGAYVFTQAGDYRGSVRITGGDPARTTPGEATLRFAADDTMAQVACYTVEQGGSIDLAGTSQRVAELQLRDGGRVGDASRRSTLTLVGGSACGVLDVAHIVKEGTAGLTLGGDNAYASFELQGGSVTLASDTALAAGAFSLAAGTQLDMAGHQGRGTLRLAAGSSVENVGRHNGDVEVTGDSRLAQGTAGSANISGRLTLGAGSRLRADVASLGIGSLAGSGSAAIAIHSTNSAAVVVNGANSGFGGELAFSGAGGNGTGYGVKFATAASMGAGTIAMDGVSFYLGEPNTPDAAAQATLHIGGRGATLNGSSGQSYYLGGLSGEGTLRTYLRNAGTLWFRGDVSSFSGTLDSNRNDAVSGFTFGFGGGGVRYHAVTGSVETGAIALFAEGGATLASSTRNALTYEFRYADDVLLNATAGGNAGIRQSGTGTLVLATAHTATGSLDIAEGGTVGLEAGASWAGSLSGAGLLVNRSTQAFSSASAFSGSLALAQGSELSLGGGYSLDEGETLGVLAGSEPTGARLVLDSLTLNGGELAFSAAALLVGGGAALELGQAAVVTGTAFGGTQGVLLQDTATLAAGSYTLASGDWSALDAATVRLSGLADYFAPTVTAGADGLHLALALREGTSLWAGTAAQHAWSGTAFGSAAQVPGAEARVYFNDAAACREVQVTEAVTAGALVFDTALGYSLAATDGGSLSATGMQVQGGGTVALGAGVSVSGAVAVAEGSELKLGDFGNLAATATVSGLGVLGVDAGETSGSLAADLSGIARLRLHSGRYQVADGAGMPQVEVVGGQYCVTGGTHANAITVSGGGWGADAAALHAEGGAGFTGALTLASDATMAVGAGGATLRGALVTGAHTLAKTGGGELRLAGGGITGNIEVQEGTLRVQQATNLGTVTLRGNTLLNLGDWNSQFAAQRVLMEDGSRINLWNGNPAGGLFRADIALSGQVAIAGSSNGGSTKVQGMVQGDGTLQLLATGGNRWTVSAAVADADGGALAVSAESYVTLSGNNSYSGGTTVRGGVLTTAHENALGSGAVTVEGGTLKLSADLRVASLNGSGGTVDTDGKQLVLGGELSGAYAGRITGGGTLCKQGGGCQEFTGKLALAQVDVSDGTLALRGAGAALALGAGSSLVLAATSDAATLEQLTASACTLRGAGGVGLIRGAAVSLGAPGNYSMAALELRDTDIVGTAESVTLSLQNVLLGVDAHGELVDGSTYGDDYAGSLVRVYTVPHFSKVTLTGSMQLDVSELGVKDELPAFSFMLAAVAPPTDPDYVLIDFGDSVDAGGLVLAMGHGNSPATRLSASRMLFAVGSPLGNTAGAPQGIPEPAAPALALLGLAALALRRRR